MALAPPLKQDRVSQILSSVKCSNCSRLVPADELADHVCAVTATPTSPTPPPPARPSPSQAILAKIRMEAHQNSPSPPPTKSPPLPSPSPPATTPGPHLAHHQHQASRSDRPTTPSLPPRTGTPSIRSRTPVLPPQGPPPPRPPPQAPLPPPLVIPPQGFSLQRQQSPAPRSLTPGSAERSTPPPMSANRSGSPSIRNVQPHQQPYQHQQNRSMQLTSPVVQPPRGHSPLSASPSGHSPQSLSAASPQRLRSPSSASSASIPSPASAAYPPPPEPRGAPSPFNGIPSHPPPAGAGAGGEVNMAGVGRRAFQAAAHAAMLSASMGSRPSGMQSPLNPHQQGQPWGPDTGQFSESHIRIPPPGMDGRRHNAPRHLNIEPLKNGAGMLQGGFPGQSLSPGTPHSLSPRSPISHPTSPHSGPRIANSRTPSPLSAGFRDVQQIPPASVKTPDSHRLSPALPENVVNDIARSRSASPAGTVTGRKSPLAQRLDGVVANLGVDISAYEHEKKHSVLPSPAESEGSDIGGLAYDNESGSGSPGYFPPDSPTASVRQPSSRMSQERKVPSRQTSLDRVPTEGSLIRFPSKGSPLASPGSPQSSKSLPLRSFSSSSSSSRSSSRSSTSSRYSRGTSRSTGALPPSLDTLFENPRPPPSPPASTHSSRSSRSSHAASAHPPPLPSKPVPPPLTRGATVSASATSPPMKSPKLPTRSRTAPSLSTPPHKHQHLDDASRPERDERPRAISSNDATRPRQCSRCSSTITDGRWIPIDIPPNTSAAHVASLSSGINGGVLCEKCWKAMYLPKCRRCGHVIEKQAVSSADGQLKGKYHRECFTCFRCHKPFPDKEFYIYDGKPFCRYHYHEANNSLCAGCGQPIEGACAIAHSGERFHPEHLICEYEFPYDGPGGKTKCREPLAEYWEVDGRMLCEKHALLMSTADTSLTATNDQKQAVVGGHVAESNDPDDDGRTPTPQQRRGFIQVGGESSNGDDKPKDAADARRMRRKTQFIDLR